MVKGLIVLFLVAGVAAGVASAFDLCSAVMCSGTVVSATSSDGSRFPSVVDGSWFTYSRGVFGFLFPFQWGSVTKLTISGVGITEIADSAFNALTSLTFLDLSDNLIARMGAASAGLSSTLTTLNLGVNVLQTIDSTTCSNLGHLQYLNVSRNNIVTFSANAFFPTPKLTAIDMTYNSMETLPRRLFSSLTSYTGELDLVDGLGTLTCVPLPPPRIATGNYQSGGLPICGTTTTAPAIPPLTPHPTLNQSPQPHTVSRSPTVIAPSVARSSFPSPSRRHKSSGASHLPPRRPRSTYSLTTMSPATPDQTDAPMTLTSRTSLRSLPIVASPRRAATSTAGLREIDPPPSSRHTASSSSAFELLSAALHPLFLAVVGTFSAAVVLLTACVWWRKTSAAVLHAPRNVLIRRDAPNGDVVTLITNRAMSRTFYPGGVVGGAHGATTTPTMPTGTLAPRTMATAPLGGRTLATIDVGGTLAHHGRASKPDLYVKTTDGYV